MAKKSVLNLGSANDAGLLAMPDITGITIAAGNGANDFVETGGFGAIVTAGNVSNDTISFGNGHNDLVEVGLATAIADTTGSGQDAIATATVIGSIIGDAISFGDGSADAVIIAPSVTVTANADATHNATGSATVVTGDISNDTITFGNGDGDTVKVGPIIANITVTGGNASTSGTFTSDGSITGDQITFGDGVGDSVDVANGMTVSMAAQATGTPTAFGNAEFTASAVVHTGEISNNKIAFGDGGGDFVRLEDPTLNFSLTADSPPGGTASGTATFFTDGTDGKVNANTIIFGNGNGDFVSAVGELSNNTITFGDGNGDSVSNVSSSFVGQSSNNKITMGNGSGDSVTLGVGVTSAGGDTIATGTGFADTVNVGTHTNADTFGFALGTNGSSFTTITGAQAGDHVISGNNLGTNVVAESGTFSTLLDFFNFVTDLPPANNNTYIGNNGADTFIVTDHHGQLGVVELVGVFTGSTGGTHILTLA